MALLPVLFRRSSSSTVMDRSVDLSRADLRGAELAHAHLDRFKLINDSAARPNIDHYELAGANLDDSALRMADNTPARQNSALRMADNIPARKKSALRMADNIPARQKSAFQVVGNWFPDDYPDREKILEVWRTLESQYYFNDQNYDDFQSFIKFLVSLQRNPSVEQPDFRRHVCSWLQDLANNSTLRDSTFLIAGQSGQTCTDRAAMTWNNMQISRLTADAGQLSPGEFLSLAQSIFRIEQLYELAREKIDTLHTSFVGGYVDEIEVYLAYLTGLRGEIDLPLAPEMMFRACSRVSDNDLREAGENLRKNEPARFFTWMTSWEPCQQYVYDSMSPAEQERHADERMSQYESCFADVLKEKELPEALANDTEVIREINPEVMERTNLAVFGPGVQRLFGLSRLG